MQRVRVETPYTEIAPPVDLARYIDRLWLRTTVRGAPGRVHRVLPDGCVDIIVDADRGAAALVGTMTRALEIPDGPTNLVAVRFKPGTAAVLTGFALAELTDRRADVAELGIADALAGRVSDAWTPEARVAAIVTWLRGRLGGAPPPDPAIGHAVAWLSSGARVDEVAREVGVSRQYLARGFRREVGVTPKQLARIARMQRAAIAIGRRGRDLARLAVELGYFDQAHLANDLRALVGVTPATLAAERPIAMSHLFGQAASAIAA
jgi:AraC-like DNA-binding protein